MSQEFLNLCMTYQGYKVQRGYKGHYHMNYMVSDVVDLQTGLVIAVSYTFENSTIFKGMKLKVGDKVTMTAKYTVANKIQYPRNVVKYDAEIDN